MQYQRSHYLTLIFVQVLFVTSSVVQADTPQSPSDYLVLLPREPIDLRLSGTSTLHRWECKATEVQAALLTNISRKELANKVNTYLAGHVPEAVSDGEMHVWLEVMPSKLECGNSRMHRDLNRAVKSDQYPEIRYWFTGIEGAPRIVEEDGLASLAVDVKGKLFLAGITREVIHTATIQLTEFNMIEASGELALDMRDFDIEPPTALLGLIRAHAELKVSYRLLLPLDEEDTWDLPAQHLVKRLWEKP